MRITTRKGENEWQDDSDAAGGIIYLTQAGLERLERELRDLHEVRLPRVREEVAHAASYGDFKENAEYQDAKKRMRGMLSREMTLQDQLKRVKIIESTSDEHDHVRLGSSVTVTVNGKERIYQIVGSTESNPAAGRISNSSPLGAALLGHVVGDDVRFQGPAGEMLYRIVAIA